MNKRERSKGARLLVSKGAEQCDARLDILFRVGKEAGAIGFRTQRLPPTRLRPRGQLQPHDKVRRVPRRRQQTGASQRLVYRGAVYSLLDIGTILHG